MDIKAFFDGYFERITYLNTIYDIGVNLSKSFNENEKIFKTAPTIFNTVLFALRTDLVVSTSRLFDFNIQYIDKDLKKCVKRSEANIARFLLLVKGRGYNVDKDIAKIKAKTEIINNLRTYRDKYIAHIDYKYLKNPELLKDIDLSFSDIKSLINLANEILNEYSILISEQGYYTKVHRLSDEIEYFIGILNEHIKIEENRVASMRKKYLKRIEGENE